jgi:hypothetical protein
MTFDQIRTRIYHDCGFTDTPAALVVTRVKDWVNEGHRRILRDPKFSKLRAGTVPFSSVIGVTIYGFPQVFERVDAIVQQTNDRRLTFMTRDRYRSMDPAERATGVPSHYVPEGYGVLFKKLLADGGIWAVSSAAGDTTQVLTYEGISTNGDQVSPAQVTLTGVTRVRLGAVTFHDLLGWNLSAVAVGTVSLYDAAAVGNEIARIAIGQRSVRYDMFRLWPTPAQVLPYVVDGQFKILDLVQDADVPMWPESYHDVLCDYGRMKEYERTQDPRLSIASGQFTEGKEKLRQYVEFPDDYTPVASSISNVVRRNNLGGWYPADQGWP